MTSVGVATADVRLENVVKRFDGTVAVDGISVEIPRGSFFALLGPSGCGKTTTLRMIGGFEEPTEGAIYLGETDVVGLPPYRRNVNTVFQSYALFPHLTVAQNVAFGLEERRLPRDEVRRRSEAALELVGLTGYGARAPIWVHRIPSLIGAIGAVLLTYWVALPLAGVTAACLLAAGPGWRPARWSLLAGGLGTAAALTGLVLTRSDLRPGVLAVEGTAAATALAAAAALFITATALAPGEDDGLRLLLLPGLVIGWTVAPLVDGAAPAAGVLALGALAIARHRPAALAFAACALAAVAPTQPAAALLAAGVVLFAAVGPALAWPALIPGVAAAALALAGGPAAVDSVAAGLAVAAGSAALATAVRAPAVLRPRSLPAAVLALWLAVAPATWAWAGEARLGDYQEGAARALAAGLLVTVVAWMTGQLRPPAPEWRSDGW